MRWCEAGKTAERERASRQKDVLKEDEYRQDEIAIVLQAVWFHNHQVMR